MSNPFLVFALTFIVVAFSLQGFKMYSNKKRDEYIFNNTVTHTAFLEVDHYYAQIGIIMPDGVVIEDDFRFRMKPESDRDTFFKVAKNIKMMRSSIKFNAKQHWDSNKLSMLFKFKRVS